MNSIVRESYDYSIEVQGMLIITQYWMYNLSLAHMCKHRKIKSNQISPQNLNSMSLIYRGFHLKEKYPHRVCNLQLLKG